MFSSTLKRRLWFLFFEKNFVKKFLIYICVICLKPAVLGKIGWISFLTHNNANNKQHSIWKLFTRSKPKKENSVRIVRASLKKLMTNQPVHVLAKMLLPKAVACFLRKRKRSSKLVLLVRGNNIMNKGGLNRLYSFIRAIKYLGMGFSLVVQLLQRQDAQLALCKGCMKHS